MQYFTQIHGLSFEYSSKTDFGCTMKKKKRLDLYGDNVFGSLSLSKGSISTHRFMTHPYTLNDGFENFIYSLI